MRSYAKFSPRFWTGETGKAIRQLGADAQALASYLITCEQSNMIGLYYLPIPHITHHVAITTERCVELLDAFTTLDFAHYDYQHEFVWVIKMATWQMLTDDEDALKPRDKRVKGVRSLLRMLRRQGAPFLLRFWERYETQLCLSEEAERQAAERERSLARPLEAPSMPGAGEGSEAGKRKIEKEKVSAAGAEEVARVAPPQPPPKVGSMRQMPLLAVPVDVGRPLGCHACEDEDKQVRCQHWLQEGVYRGLSHLERHLERYYAGGEASGFNTKVLAYVRTYLDEKREQMGAGV